MKITIKNLQQQTFHIDFDATKTVEELKTAIHEDRGGEYTIERQKLIYAGVILDDARTVASYNFDEKKFLVVMLKRDVVAAKPAATTAQDSAKSTLTSTTSTTTATSPAAEKSDAAESKQEKTTTTTTTTMAGASETGTTTATAQNENYVASNLLMGDEYERSVASMIEMGYSRDMVERAMSASFNNPERAVEYLISGIPTTANEAMGFQATPPTTATSTPLSDITAAAAAASTIADNNSRTVRATGGGGGTTTAGGAATQRDDPFDFLRNQPQFLQMRSLVYQNPDFLQAVLRQIAQTNPALLQLISEHQDEFLNMLNQPLDGDNNSSTNHNINNGQASMGNDVQQQPNRRAQLEAVTRAVSGVNVSGGGGGGAGTRGEPLITTERNPATGNQQIVLGLTATDNQAIERLKAMGFPEADVLQAYFACEKDEQLAANFLISNAFDD